MTIGEPTVVVAGVGLQGRRRCYGGSPDWARLVIVEEPEHWPESLMADIAW